jgi:hypothetical protein
VVGVGIGLGAQSLFKDIINGIFILIENQYNVGDTVKLASLTGTVEDLSLRLTTLRDGDGTSTSSPTRRSPPSPTSPATSPSPPSPSPSTPPPTPTRSSRILRATALAVRNDPAFKDVAVADPDVPGVDAISGRVVTYPVSIRVRVNQKDAILRELRRRILQAFEENAIPLGTDPNSLLVMHHADPTAPPCAAAPHQRLNKKRKKPRRIAKRAPTNCPLAPAPQPTPPASSPEAGTYARCTPPRSCPHPGQPRQRLLQHRRQRSCLHPPKPRHALVHRIPRQRAVSSARAPASSPITHTCTGSRTSRCNASA